MDNLFRKHQFSDREIVRLFTILDEDRNSSLDENEIMQWAADLGLKWSKVEVNKIYLLIYYELITNRRGTSLKQQISTQIASSVYWVSYNI